MTRLSGLKKLYIMPLVRKILLPTVLVILLVIPDTCLSQFSKTDGKLPLNEYFVNDKMLDSRQKTEEWLKKNLFLYMDGNYQVTHYRGKANKSTHVYTEHSVTFINDKLVIMLQSHAYNNKPVIETVSGSGSARDYTIKVIIPITKLKRVSIVGNDLMFETYGQTICEDYSNLEASENENNCFDHYFLTMLWKKDVALKEKFIKSFVHLEKTYWDQNKKKVSEKTATTHAIDQKMENK